MQPLSDAVLAGIVSLAADAIICIDGSQRITFFNEGASRIFGYASSEVLGRPLDMLLPVRHKAAHHAHVEAFGRSPVASRRMGERSLIAGRRADGEEFPAEAAIAKMTTPEGPVFSVVLRDVTEQRRAEKLTQRLFSEMEVAVKARDEVLGLVSHDLRNPVNAVKMLAAAILRTDTDGGAGTLPPDVVEHATVMLQAANQMDALIQDLLDVTRLEAGRMQIVPQACALGEVVHAAVDMLAPLAAAKSISLDFQLPEDLPLVHVDPARMVQVLSNLVGNAIKFTPRSGHVSISAVGDDKFVNVTITDTGPGIAPDELPLVFDRFWQSRRTNRSGAGLGLAIARGIVRAHGGTITVESDVEGGTRVCFTAPVAGGDPD